MSQTTPAARVGILRIRKTLTDDRAQASTRTLSTTPQTGRKFAALSRPLDLPLPMVAMLR